MIRAPDRTFDAGNQSTTGDSYRNQSPLKQQRLQKTPTEDGGGGGGTSAEKERCRDREKSQGTRRKLECGKDKQARSERELSWRDTAAARRIEALDPRHSD